MADTKLTDLTLESSPVGTDILYFVDNPGGTPLSRKTTVADLLAVTHTHTAANLSDASTNGRSLITAANYAAMRALLDLEAGTDFYSIAAADSAFATAAQGATADTALQPGGALGTPSSGVGSNLTALNATQLTSGTIPAARIGADTIDALTEIAAALKAGTGAKLVTNGNDASVPIYTEKHAASHTIDAAECYGGVHYCTAAATITLPAVVAGMSVTVVTIGAVAVSVDPNASDLIYLDGVALDDGDKITNLSTAGDIAVLTYYDATGWYASTNSWTDGGA